MNKEEIKTMQTAKQLANVIKTFGAESFLNTVTGRTCKILSKTKVWVYYADDKGYCSQLLGNFYDNLESKKYILIR